MSTKKRKSKVPTWDEEDDFEVEEWDVRDFVIQKHPKGVWGDALPRLALIGQSGSGKTKALIDMCWMLVDQFPTVIVISGSEEGNGTYSRMVPEVFIFTEYADEIIHQVFKRQYRVTDEHTDEDGNFDQEFNRQILVLVDDCLDKTNKESKPLVELFRKGRHAGICAVLLVQYLKQLSLDIRINVNGVLIAKQLDTKVIKEIRSTWFPGFEDDQFIHYMKVWTNNYRMVFGNTKASENRKAFKYFLAQNREPNFKMGSEEFWYQGAKYLKRKPPKVRKEGAKYAAARLIPKPAEHVIYENIGDVVGENGSRRRFLGRDRHGNVFAL